MASVTWRTGRLAYLWMVPVEREERARPQAVWLQNPPGLLHQSPPVLRLETVTQ